MKSSLTLLGVSYPVLTHVAVAMDSAALMLAAVLVLVLLALVPGLARGSRVAFASVLPCVAAVVALHRVDATVLLLYLPPVAINLALAWLFGHTLVAGRVPLVEQLVRLLHAPGEVLDPAIAPYARRLTLAWAAVLVSLAVVNFVLALFATPDGLLLLAGVTPPWAIGREIWSAFANFVNYAVIAGFFIAEYLYRRRRFPRQPYAGFVDFCTRAAAVGPRLFARGRHAGGELAGSP